VSARVLPLVLCSKASQTRRNVQIGQRVAAGWTGRDRAPLEKHIAELAAIGIKRPARAPISYRISAAGLTTDDSIEALGKIQLRCHVNELPILG
jgi:uncharacterized protein DUF2848